MLEERAALVSGGGRSSVRAIARRSAQSRAQVIVADINDAGGNETVEDIQRGAFQTRRRRRRPVATGHAARGTT